MQTCAFTFRVDSSIPKFELSSQQPAIPMTVRFDPRAKVTVGAPKGDKRPINYPKSRISRALASQPKNNLLLVGLPAAPAEETINSKQDSTFPLAWEFGYTIATYVNLATETKIQTLIDVSLPDSVSSSRRGINKKDILCLSQWLGKSYLCWVHSGV